MEEMLAQLSTTVRLIVAGLIWGVFCGVGSVLVVVLLLIAEGVGSDFYWAGAVDFIVGLPLYVATYCAFGAVVGGVIGLLSGLVAGPLLAAILRLVRPSVAVAGTVILVLTAQVVVGLSVSGSIWVSVVAPVVGIIPMTSSTRGAASGWSTRRLAASELARPA